MSLKEGTYVILDGDEDAAGRLLIADVVDSDLLLNDSRISCVLPEKSIEENLNEKDVIHGEKDLNSEKTVDYITQYSFSCAICQNVCGNCKHICVTCKSPCPKCSSLSCKNCSTDTDDFDKFFEEVTWKVKIPPKTKTVSTDTCDLEGHFDYYKLERKTVRIQKSVGTDCSDLISRKFVAKKPVKNSVAIDTRDLTLTYTKLETIDESDCDFFWTNQNQSKTYAKKLNTDKSLNDEETHGANEQSENTSVINEDSSFVHSIKIEEGNSENTNIESQLKELTFDHSSTDESDIDLATSSKVFKCRQLARKHKITLKQISKDKDVIFKCSICGETFPKKYLGILHLGSHVENDKFKCFTCNDNFETLELLYFHVQHSHSDDGNCESKPSIKDVAVKVASEPERKVNRVYQCAICLSEGKPVEEFVSSKVLNLHMKLNHGVGVSNESVGNRKTGKKQRVRKEFICLLCGKQFRSSKALKDHSPVHTGEKNYHCDICKKSYTTSANLKIHKRIHTGAKNFVCSVCGKAFHKKDSLKVHFRKHSGERPFQCDLCPMRFDRNYILKNHRYTHFSEKTFICPVCGKTFTTHGGLNNHEKGHKKDPFDKKPRKPAVKPTLDAENAVMCDVCGKVYSTRSNLRIHKFVHLGVKPFECTICHQTYAKKDSMLTHMRKHTDERPFACSTCGMTFYRNHTLKTHLLRHTGERPHKCKMCGKSFTQSSSLAYHLRNHDKNVENKKIVIVDDPTKLRKKRVNQSSKTSGSKKGAKTLKTEEEFQSDNVKVLFEDKKPEEETTEIAVMKNQISMNLTDKETEDLTKESHYILPVPGKEILILDKNLGVELPRSMNSVKEMDFFSLDKDISYNNQCNVGKYNYYIAKGHVFSLTKDGEKPKNSDKNLEISIDKHENVENLIISKNSYITKEGNLVTLNASGKEIKEEYVQVGDDRTDLKPPAGIPIAAEILNATFISDENGDVIPFTSMALQGLNSESVMISPLIPVEGDDRKGLLRNSKVAMVDPKVTYSLAPPRTASDKSSEKGNCHVINIKDPRISQKIQIELDSPSLQIQGSVADSGALHGISGFYNALQQNEM